MTTTSPSWGTCTLSEIWNIELVLSAVLATFQSSSSRTWNYSIHERDTAPPKPSTAYTNLKTKWVNTASSSQSVVLGQQPSTPPGTCEKCKFYNVGPSNPQQSQIFYLEKRQKKALLLYIPVSTWMRKLTSLSLFSAFHQRTLPNNSGQILYAPL